jgi:hypothetical protein
MLHCNMHLEDGLREDSRRSWPMLEILSLVALVGVVAATVVARIAMERAHLTTPEGQFGT